MFKYDKLNHTVVNKFVIVEKGEIRREIDYNCVHFSPHTVYDTVCGK